MYVVLPLAVEYQIKDIKGRCESYLEKNLSLKTLVIAEKYDLDQLQYRSLVKVKQKTLKALQAEPEYKLLSKESLEKLLMAKYNEMEELLMAKYNEMEELLMAKYNEMEYLLMAKYNQMQEKANKINYKYETLLSQNEQTTDVNERNKKKLTLMKNELECYEKQFFSYYNPRSFHLAKCNFENFSGTNPGGDTWSDSNRCDYCLCQKLIKIL